MDVQKQSQPFRLAGQYLDEETGLCYVLARYYNPQLGRFLTPDPQGFAGGSLNLYTYCDGDPVNKIDPTGELAFLAIVGIIAVGAAIGAIVGAGIEAWKQHKQHPDKPLDWGAIGSEAWKGAAVGAVGTGVGLLLGPLVGGAGAGLLAAAEGGAVIGGISAGIEQCVNNELHHKPFFEGIWPAIGTGVVIGAVTAGVGAIWTNRARRAAQAAREAEEAARRAEQEAARRAEQEAKTTVYRVEGSPNKRIIIGERGQVSIQGDKMLFLNFGEKARAEEFLAKRLEQGMPGAELKSFEIPESFLTELQETAIPESMARQFPGRPILVDPTKAPNQFGLRPDQIRSLQDAIIQGTGRTH